MFRPIRPALALAVLAGPALAASTLLWEIGRPDNANTDLALAPSGYAQFRQDGFFVVGQSDPQSAWPYVHPGPADAWAGSQSHTFTVLFQLETANASEPGRLCLDFLDTHAGLAPRLRVTLNGHTFERTLPPGGGDASVNGDVARGRECLWELELPPGLLRRGENSLDLTSLSGSWCLYDSLQLFTAADTRLAAVPAGTRLSQVTVAPYWLQATDGPVQPVQLRLQHIGDPTEAKVRIGDRAPLPIRLQSGWQTIEVTAPAAETTTQVPLEVTTAGNTLVVTNLTLAPPKLREIWLLPHSHVDIGYTHLQDEVIGIQITNLLHGIELAQASATNPPGLRFKWNPEAIWVLDHFLNRATPAEREAFVSAVRRGDVGVDGLYANMLTGLCRPEELAQSLRFAPAFTELTGVPVASAAICDVPGWTWGLVSMMEQAGVKYFAIGPNHSARIGTIHRWDNQPFYWRSPSGRERLLCYVVDNYHFLGNLEHHVRGHTEKLTRTGYPYDLAPLFWVGTWPGGGVDNAPPDALTVDKAVAWNRKYAVPRVIIGLAGEFFRELERRHGPQLPEFAGDLTPYWEDGAGSTARETALNRRSADRLSQAETLFAGLAPADRSPAAFEAAWKNVLLYSEHTWGAHNSISEPDVPFVVDQWRVKQAFALDADRQSRALLDAALAASSSAQAPPTTFDVFNTTQWERTDLVTLTPGQSGKATSVTDDAGQPVPSQRLSSGQLAFLAEKVPPFGAKRFRLSSRPAPNRGQARLEGLTLCTPTLSVGVDGTTGALRSLRRQGLEADLVDPQAPVGLNDYRYVLGTNAAGALVNGPVTFQVLNPGPLVVTVRLESSAPGCRRLVREVQLVDGLDYVSLVNHVDREAVREKDSVHFGFGFHVPGGMVRMETPWAVVRPNIDQLPGACRNWFTVQRWVDVSNSDHGITWAPLDAPLLQVGAMTANLLGAVGWDEWLTETPDSTTLYSWAQNNHWFTNYKADQPGLTTFRYLLRPHPGGYHAPEAARFGHETSRPLLAVSADPSRPVPAPFLRLSSPDVLLETVKVSEDGQAIILRLFGVTGQHRRVRVDWTAFPPAAIWLTDLSEAPRQRTEPLVDVPGYSVTMLRLDRPPIAAATDSEPAYLRLVPVPAPPIVAAADEYPGGNHKAAHLLDGNPRTEYSSANRGTNTFVEFDFATTISLAGFRHLDRNDPATVAASELVLFAPDGSEAGRVAIQHANQKAGVTFHTLPEPVAVRRVRWQVTQLGPHHYGTVGGAELAFFAAGPTESLPNVALEARPLPLAERTPDGLRQPLRLEVDYAYATPIDAVVQVGDLAPRPLRLTAGRQSLDIPIPLTETARAWPLSITTSDGQRLGAKTLEVPPFRPLTIYVLPHSHTDIGYTELQTAIEEKQVNNLLAGMEAARRTASYPEGARFVWNVEVLWAADLFLRRFDTTQRDAFLAAVQRGEVALCGLYLNELTGLCRPEELIRLLRFATQLRAQTGASLQSAMISDVPGYTWGTVTALAHAGIKYFSVAPNYFDRIGDILVQWENRPFWWVGPDGHSRVLVWIPFWGYALSHRYGHLSRQLVEDFAAGLEQRAYPYDLAYVRWAGHGDNGVPDPAICDFIRDWNQAFASPRFVISSTDDAFRAFEARYGHRLPEVRGDWTPYWEDGAGSSALETALNRASSDRMTQAEALWAIRQPRSYPVPDFADAWRQVLLYSEHTWGAWCSVSEPARQETLDQWALKHAYAAAADTQSRELLSRAAALDASGEALETAVDLFNTTSWPRTELVVIPRDFCEGRDRVTDDQGHPVPSQRLVNGDLVLLARDVPPLAARRYTFTPGSPHPPEHGVTAAGTRLDNGLLRLRLDDVTGAITELFRHDLDVNLADATSGHALNDYLYFTGDQPADAQRNGLVTIRVKERGPLVASLLVGSAAPGCHRLERELRLTAGLDYVELINLVDKQRLVASSYHAHDGKESLNFAFPFHVPDGQVRLEVPLGVIRPDADQIPSACKNWFTVGRWADVANADFGVTWVTLDAPLVQVGGLTANLLNSQTNPDVWRKHVGPTQKLYSWAMNNHWGTNYRAYQEGPVVFRYVLRPHRGYDPAAASRLAVAQSQPLVPVRARGPRPSSTPRLAVDSAEVLVTGLKPSDDGRALIVRLWAASDHAVPARLAWSDPRPVRVSYSDTSEQAGAPLTGPVAIPAWGLITLRADLP
jgi:alpha-mannosidase